MKKTSFVFVTMLTVLLSGLLMACSFKKAEAKFLEIDPVSINDTINLDDYLEVKGVDESDVDYRFSNQSLFKVNGRVIKAVLPGRSLVYATYKNNSLGSAEIVVKDKFAKPSNFSLSESGVLSWAAVTGYFAGDTEQTVASSYTISGTYIPYDEDGNPKDEEQFLKTSNSNSIELIATGKYSLSVVANAAGFFDESEKAVVSDFYFGLIDVPDFENLSFASNGVFSWSAVENENVKYKVKLDGKLLGAYQTATSKNISQYLENASAGLHELSVVVFDVDGQKLANESEKLYINKLETPNVSYDFASGGKVVVEADDAVEDYVFVLKKNGAQAELFMMIAAGDEDLRTSLDGLESGVYQLSVRAKTSAENCYQSSLSEAINIYKLPKISNFEGVGGNELDSTGLNAFIAVEKEVLFDTNVAVSGIGGNNFQGIVADEKEAVLQISIPQAGAYSLKARLLPKMAEYEYNQQPIYVLQSEESSTLNVNKLAFASSVEHKYVEENSVFVFDKIDGASYVLQNAGQVVSTSKYSLPVENAEGKMEIVFNGKIDDLFDIFEFEIIANGDEKTTIGASCSKVIEVLEAPTSAGSGNSSDKTYIWNASENAGKYKLEIYSLSKEQFVQAQNQTLDLSALTYETEIVVQNEYAFDKAGYYCVKIYALLGEDGNYSENEYLGSKDYLKEIFYISEQIELDEVKFGGAEDENPTNAESGYFVRMQNATNAKSFEISVEVGNKQVTYTKAVSEGQDYSDYFFVEDFAEGVATISVRALADDSTIYLASEAVTIVVEKLQNVTYDSFVQGTAEIDELTQNLTVKAIEGASEIVIRKDLSNKASGSSEKDAVYPISNLNNVEFSFEINGTIPNAEGFYETDHVYLGADDTTLRFVRHATPTEFEFKNNKLTFEDSEASLTNVYVLNLNCKTSANEDFEIKINFEATSTYAIYNGTTFELPSDVMGMPISYRELNGNAVTINLDLLLAFINADDTLKSVYANAAKVEFEAYVYKNSYSSTKGYYELSSLSATCKADSSENTLTVEKMKGATLEFDKETETNYVLKWNAVTLDDAEINAQTTYKVYLTEQDQAVDGDVVAQADGVLSFEFSKAGYTAGKYYNFYLVATNPYYLDSNNSNLLKLYKLRIPTGVKVKTNGTLELLINSSESDFVTKAAINGSDHTDFANIAATGSTLQVKLIGQKIENGDITTNYIDSDIATWTLADFATLKPTDLTLTYSDDADLSWNKFAESQGLGALKYKVILKDGEGKIVEHTLIENKINMLSGDLYSKISTGLSEGNIDVQVVAYLEEYIVSQTSTIIYYSAEQATFNGNMYNSFVYGDVDITKLATPNITQVDIENADFDAVNYPTFGEMTFGFDVHNPSLVVYFEGNYGDSVDIIAYVNDDIAFEGTVSKSNDLYSFEIDAAYYEFDEQNVMTISIAASVAKTIPSSLGSIEISRSNDLQSVEFVGESGILTSDLKVVLAENAHAAGGIVLKIDYEENGGEAKTAYSLARITSGTELVVDLDQFVAENLSNGGKIKISAYVNSLEDDTNSAYYLPSENAVVTEEIEILKAVEETDISKKSGGFVIDSALNGIDCTYVIAYASETYEIEYNGEEYYFEVPNDWMNGTYELEIYAKESGKIASATTAINFELDRVGAIDKSTFAIVRDETDLSKVSMSWAKVDGATGYLFRVYDQEDKIFEQDLQISAATAETYVLKDLFGENYSNFVVENPINYFKEDKSLTFEIVANGNGTTTNSSKLVSFDVLLKGNFLLGQANPAENFAMDEFGRLNFAGVEDDVFIYKFSTENITNDPWKELAVTADSVIVDTTEFSKLATTLYFNLTFASKGDSTSFELDSCNWTTQNSTLTMKFNNSIVSVGYNENNSSNISLELATAAFETIYVGKDEKALVSGEVVALPFVETEIASGSALTKIYSCSMVDLIKNLEFMGLEPSDEEITVYLWAKCDVDSVFNVASAPIEFAFVLNEEDTFEEVSKVGQVIENEVEIVHDYANTYAIFEDVDVAGQSETIGIYVKIENNDFVEDVIKYISKVKLLSAGIEDKFAINLTNLFEESDLIQLTGEFKVSFARLQLLEGEKFAITDWLERKEEEFVFNRLQAVSAVYLREGSVYWTGFDGGKYYVYFAEDVDEETLKLGEVYTTVSVDEDVFDASAFVGTNKAYYIAVQQYGEDKFDLPSRRVFVSEVQEDVVTPIEVYKNQINSDLVLDDGKIFIDWTNDCELKTILADNNSTSSDLIKDVPFEYPFTFRLKDLINNNLMFRLSFTSAGNATGIQKSYDVNAKYLLADLFAEDDTLKTKLNKIYEREQDSQTRDLLDKFIKYCESASFGVANSKVLFDQIFETLQAGAYSLRYCLLGSNSTLNSAWKEFKNQNGENLIYVNAQPESKIVADPDQKDISINKFKIFIKRSKIVDYVNDAYADVYAENYVIRLASNEYSYVLNISKGIDSYNLTLQGADVENSVSVYQTDINGTIVVDDQGKPNGDYLMVYINHNDGNSILGVYGDLIKKWTYDMQIYAVGNAYSMSSKSEYHSLTLLSFGDSMTVVNGEFAWQPYANRTTKVIYKRSNNDPGSTDVNLSEDGFLSRFSFSGIGAGTYEYVKFVMLGKPGSKATFVDSEIYQFNNVYKLSQPVVDTSNQEKTILANDLGYLSIGLGDENKALLDNSYSDSCLYGYRIYNDASNYRQTNSTTYIDISDSRASGAGETTLYYQPGVTEEDNSKYKQTEASAKTFSVSLLGSTIGKFDYKVEVEENAGYNAKYHLRTFKLVDSDESFRVALRSNVTSINAQMMKAMGQLSIEDSLLKWNEVEVSAADEKLSVESPIYKVTISGYKTTQVDESTETQTSEIKQISYYTAKTSFDFAKVEDKLRESFDDNSKLKVVVNALSLNISQNEVEGAVELVEGGFAYGNTTYLQEDGTDSGIYILMSNSSSIDEITRLNPVENVSIVEGKLNWVFVAEPSLTESDFRKKYGFEVVQNINGEENVVEGSFVIANSSTNSDGAGVYSIVFTEAKGGMLAGEGILAIYAKQGTDVKNNSIKSFANAIVATKIAPISNQDFEIVSQAGEDFEVLDFSKYFDGKNTYSIKLNATVGGVIQREIVFTKDASKLYIFKSQPGSVTYKNGFVKDAYFVVEDSRLAKLVFVSANNGMLYSDISEEFVLQRSSWEDGSQIVWDEESQVFSWEYDYKTFSENEELVLVSEQYIAKEGIKLYQDPELSIESEVTVEAGMIFGQIEDMGDTYRITYLDVIFYAAKDSVERVFYDRANVVSQSNIFENAELTEMSENLQQLEAGMEVLIVEASGTSAKIYYLNSTYYIGLSNLEIKKQMITAGDLFKFVESDVVEISDGTTLRFVAEEVQIVEPEFTIVCTYGTNEKIVRTYQTNKNTFVPTIIGQVQIAVTVKMGSVNVESQRLQSEVVEFDLFESGAGTAGDAYVITNGAQFKNIGYRMQKEEYLADYYQEDLHADSSDGTQYYFSLENSLMLVDENAFEGILFDGEFDGVFEGNSKTISYHSTKTVRLSQNIAVEEGNVVKSSDFDFSHFYNGAALFETLSENAEVKNLNISAKFGDSVLTTLVNNHAIISALAVENKGKVDNVKIVGFESGLYGDSSSIVVMAYAGVAGVNNGTFARISNSSVQTNITINDYQEAQLIFFGGISFANLSGGVIEDCQVGSDNEAYQVTIVCQETSDVVQLAGVVVTNSTTATVQRCVNNLDLSVVSEPSSDTNITKVYIAGVACYGKGSTIDNVNEGTLLTTNISAGNLITDSLYAVQ